MQRRFVVDRQRAVGDVRRRHRVVAGVAVIAAGIAAVVAEAGAMAVDKRQPFAAFRAVDRIVIPCGLLRQAGRGVDSEPADGFCILCKARDQRIVCVQNQLHLRGNRIPDALENKLRVAVARHLVAVEVQDGKVGRPHVAEGMAGILFVRFHDDHIALYPARQRRIADQHGGDALNLVGSFPVPADVHAGPLQDADNHLHGGCFAVGAGDCDDAIRQLHPRNDIRADFQRQLTGLGRAFFDNAARQCRQLTNHDCKQFSHRFSPFLCSGIK